MSTQLPSRGLLVAFLVLLSAAADGQTPLLQSITRRSGNGTIGSTDSQIRMLVGPANAPFPAPFTPTDFVSAAGGPPAFVINPDPAWLTSLPADPAAQWIGTVTTGFGQGSALYAVSFNVAAAASIVSATITLNYAVDNFIGSTIAPGVYLNGTPLSGSTFLPACAVSGCAGYGSQSTMVRNDIAPLLLPGNNTLYIYGNDTGVTGGLLFSATVDVYGFAIPEYQTNFSLGSSLDVNGVQGTQYVPATVTVPIGMPATLGLSSANIGQLWDVVYGLAPLVPASAGAAVTYGQIINLDLSDPSLGFWFNLLQGPTWGPNVSRSIPFAVPNAAAVSLQMIVVDPSLSAGFALSQPVRLIVQ